MDRTELHNNFMKHGLLVMVLAAFGVLVLIPLLASADCEHEHWDQTKRGEFPEKRQSMLHDKLGLSALQEPAWKDFIAKLKPSGQTSRPSGSELSKLSTPDRLDRMLAVMKDRERAMEAHAEAIKTFYAQLTPEQKKMFDASFFHPKDGHERHGEPKD